MQKQKTVEQEKERAFREGEQDHGVSPLRATQETNYTPGVIVDADLLSDCYSIVEDLEKATTALFGIANCLENLADFSIEATGYILKLIANDIESIRDDVTRRTEGRCPIRHAAHSALRPPKEWEAVYQSKPHTINGGV